MPEYPDLEAEDALWPSEGYAVIAEDSLKPPDSDDFVTVLCEHETPEFELPPPQPGYTYWVHDASGQVYTREEWDAVQK